jgi:photosystem II stability/assembly factor-like uncharacterized protein
MFRHLDDPTPPAADGAQLRSVLRRSDRLRFERRRRWASTAVAVALCSALLATGLLSVRTAGPQLAGRETAYQFNQAVHLRVGTPVPTTTLTDVVFVDSSDGFALATHRNVLVLAATTDGGSTWDIVNRQLPGASSGDRPDQMEFVSASTGYLWEGIDSQAVVAPLWTTHDGGRTWGEASIGPVVYDVSAIGPNVWALVSSCPTTVGTDCAVVVEISTDAGGTWRAALVPAGALSSVESGGVELARVTTTRAYVLATTPSVQATGPSQTPTLTFTSDGGDSWSGRVVPCADPFDLGAEIALSSTDDLWLICGGQASAGSQAKALYRSSTGGLTWSLVAQTSPFAGAPASPPGVGVLPLNGYVAPYSLGHKNLNVLSSTLAWLFPTRGNVIVTTDGGSSWAAVSSLQEQSFGSGAPGNLTFISSTEGWVTELGVGLWHTTDGTNWLPLGT